jgi:hypothetical protein
MNKLRFAGLSFAAAFAALTIATTSALGAEARPWLCRDKPVFSDSTAMNYSVTTRGGRAWRMFFMQFEPDAAHDGFEIVRSAPLSPGGDAVGSLEAGRYFAVAMYASGGNWICPGYAEDSEQRPAGQLYNICYGEDGPPCLVTLAIMRPTASH